mgnify:FL=1|tara:strand:+ start:3234 stop:3848 length:615 start_codon:yes stop_codon:yes gene_type:complete
MNKISGQIIRAFSPAIGKYKISEKLIKTINEHIDVILKDQNKIDELYHGKNLAGEIKYEIKLTKDFIEQHLYNSIKDILFNFVKSTLNKEFRTFEIKSSWAVCQFESDYNPIHWHDGHFSGVMYTKIPNSFGGSYKEINKNGNIAFIHGSTQLTASSVYDVKPEVGDLFIFPSNMMHTVYPFFSDEERRSVSFNVFLDHQTVKV